MTRFRRGNTGGASGVVDVQVGASADDGYSGGAIFESSHPDTIIGTIATVVYDSWSRFTNVTIPQGAIIDLAYITTEAPADSTADGTGTESNLYMNDVDDAFNPISVANHAAKARTTNFTAWDDITFVTDTPTNSLSIVDVVQEIVDRGGWNSGQAMMILWDDDVSTNGKFYRQKSFNHEDTGNAMKLHVEWSS